MIPGDKWTELKKELVTRWQELSENDLDSTQGESRSVIDLLEKKLGMAFEEASDKFSEMASRYQLYDEPEDEPADVIEEKRERVLELRPKAPANMDRKPKNPSINN
jgi:hypothetical protein